MNKFIESIGEEVARKATEAVREVLSSFKAAERLLIIALVLIDLSFISALREEKENSAQKGPRKTS